MNRWADVNKLSTGYRQVMNTLSTPKCPHFSVCSGCEIFLDETPALWSEALAFFRPLSIEPRLRLGTPLHWRLKAKLAVRGSVDSPIIGLFKKGTHEAVSIPQCLVHHPSINQGVKLLSKALFQEKISIYDENKKSGLVRYVQFFAHRTTGALQLSLVINADSLPSEIERLCGHFSGDLWHSLWINFHPAANNRVLGSQWQKVWGEPWLRQPFLKQEVPFHPGAFSQANLELFEALVQSIQSWIRPGDRLVELFAGVGLIGASLSSLAANTLLVENNPFAALSFQERFGNNPPCRYLLQDATEFSDFSSFNLILVDPPRKGLGPILLKKLTTLSSSRLIYISCGFESFQKDCKALLASGWALKEAEGFFLFPGTNHIEIAALFEKQ